MLQSSNQYLRPDYLAAVPNALDTKSSPLALLAQTCSAIGADTTNPKLLAANIEKSTKSLKSTMDGARDKSSPVGSQSSSVSTGSVEQIKSSFKPYESNNNNNHVRERLDAEAERAANFVNLQQQQQQQQQSQQQSSHRVKTPKNNGQQQQQQQQHHHQHQQLQHQQQLQQQQQQLQQRCDSNQSATSQRDSPAAAAGAVTTNGQRRTPSATAIDLQQRHSSNNSPQQQQQRSSSKESSASQQQQHQQHQHQQHQHIPQAQASPSSNSNSSSNTASRLQAASEAAYAAAKEASYVKALHAAAAAAGIPTSSSGGIAAYYPGGYPGAGGGGGMPYPMDLMTASALMSPHHPMFKAAALNPYLNYARLKGFDISTAAAMMSPNICRDPYCTGCPSNPHYLNKAAGQPCPAGCPQCEGGGGGGGGGKSGGGNNAASAASSYTAQLAALAAAIPSMPYLCSWNGSEPGSFCGKRFSTSDELFQHVRTHAATFPESVLSAAAAGGIPPNHPLFQRTYPTPPLSPLSAARYHPYGKPSMLPPSLGPPGSLAGLPMPPHPAFAQYFSAYSLYGPRMGSSHP